MEAHTTYHTFTMAQPNTAASGGERHPAARPVDLNVMKRNMTIAKGFLDISLLSANANQLRNVINYGDRESNVFYIILVGIIVSVVLQVLAGIVLILAEQFDINKEEDQERGDTLNTVVVCLIFIVLIINVFVASLGVDVVDPFQPTHDHGYDYSLLGSSTPTTPPISGSKDLYG